MVGMSGQRNSPKDTLRCMLHPRRGIIERYEIVEKSMAELVMRVSRKLAGVAMRKNLTLKPSARVVSFTFDDAPRSACLAGAAILERLGARGTFYIAGGLTDKIEEGRPCHSVDDLKALHQAGHELGCHGFSHQRYDQSSAKELNAELDRNARFLQQFGVNAANSILPIRSAHTAWAPNACAARVLYRRALPATACTGAQSTCRCLAAIGCTAAR